MVSSKKNWIKQTQDSFFKKIVFRLLSLVGLWYAQPEFFDADTVAQRGQGFVYKNAEFIHHANLAHNETAFFSFMPKQKLIIVGIVAIVALAVVINWHGTILFCLSALVVLYFFDSLFNAFLIYRSFAKSPELKISEAEVDALQTNELPLYTVFCPLYKEWQVVPQFVRAMSELDYPKEKLQIMLLLEEDDSETVEKIRGQALPQNFDVVVVPHSKPKTKPKAMNYGLKFVKGEYLVIYDAEDVPEPGQLKKALVGFTKALPGTVCVQAKLNFYNPRQNILTRVFTAEYSLWFDLVLPGLQSIGAPIPLGGTSNHFKVDKLRELGGWDAFNVTEDCDLGMRLAKRGYRTAIVDSLTLEEANSDLINWYRQRSRWIKGYIQTYLVHMRRPQDFAESGSWINVIMLQLTVGGKITSMFINPLMWLITAVYFLMRAKLGLFIESFFPTPILYIGVTSLVFGNFLYLYYYMIGCAKRGQYGLIKYVYLVPLYWLYMSAAAWQALYEVIVKPHYWAKTVHGLHINKNAMQEADELTEFVPAQQIPQPQVAFTPAANPGPVVTNPKLSPQFSLARLVQKLFSGSIGAGGVLVLASLAANFFNFLFNAILGRALTLEDFATVTLFNTVLNISAVALGALSGAVTYRTAHLVGQQRTGLTRQFVAIVKKYVWIISGILSVLWLAATPVFAHFFRINSIGLIFAFTPVISLGSIAAVQTGYLRGRFRFAVLGQAIVYEALSKTIIALLLVQLHLQSAASLAIPSSIIISFAVSLWFVKKVSVKDSQEFGQDAILQDPFPKKYFTLAMVTGFAGTIFLNVDVLLAKHYLSPGQAGAYALLSLVGKMVYFMGGLLSPFVVSVVSRHEGAGTNALEDFYALLLGVLLLAGGSFVGLGFTGKWLVPLLFGARSLSIIPYLTPYGLAMALFAFSSTIVGFHLIKKQYSFAWLMLASTALLIIGIVAHHASIEDFTAAMLLSSVVNVTVTFVWHLARRKPGLWRQRLGDIFGIFKTLPQPVVAVGAKRILMFNWRDTKHAYAGGAEVYVHELGKRWVAAGNHVTLFCGNDGHHPELETLDGVQVVRRGGFYLVYVWAFIYYMLKFRGKFDVILDCHNGVPFFSPIYAKEKVYCLMHHVHQQVFYRHLPWPLSSIAAFLENTMMPLIYRRTKFITISDSSKQEMLDLGLGQEGLEIVHPGVDLENLEPGKKLSRPLVVYLGRLKAYKSVDVLIYAFASIVARLPRALLVIAGDGEERGNLMHLAESLNLKDNVIFTGKISEREKISLLKKAWVFCNPSMMEGWGITTIEANACGVPVVAADVPGLRDSVNNPHTGYLAPHGNSEAFADKILSILLDPTLHQKMSQNSLSWSSRFGWDNSANNALRILYG